MHTNISSLFCLVNHLSKSFSITRFQVHILAAFLFIIVVDYIFQQTDNLQGLKAHVEIPEENLPYLDFTSDIVLLDETNIDVAEHYNNQQNKAS